ncbi:MAG: beta-propeller fold lactonase family protein [Albidovulum sp.]|nr:beta-propeller fold lactonase family protein [Albidovulum sp.]
MGRKDGKEENHIDAFELEPLSGRLLPISSTVIAARMAYITVDRKGSWLLGASFRSSLIAVYSISGRGQIRPVGCFSMAMANRAHQILLDHSNRYAFVPNLGADLVVQLLFDERNGMLRENSPSSVNMQNGAGCRHIAFHPNCRFVYPLNELDGSIVVFGLDASNGTLVDVGKDSILRPDITGNPWCAQIHVSRDETRLFASERRGRTLACWNIEPASGQLSNRTLIETGRNPR